MRKAGLAVAVCLSVSLGILAGWLNRDVPKAPQLSFSPATLNLTDRLVLQGDPIESSVMLENLSDQKLTITAIDRSCGCLSVGNEVFASPPFPIEAQEQIPLAVNLGTHGRVGRHVYSVMVRASAESQAAPVFSELKVICNISAALSSRPPQVTLRYDAADADQEFTGQLELFDTWPEKIEIKDIICSSDAIDVKLESTGGVIDYAGEHLDKRFTLRYCVTPEKFGTDQHGSIRVVTDQSRLPELTIPVVLIPSRSYTVSPPEIVVVGTTGTTITRHVAFRWSGTEPHSVRVVDHPPEVTRISQVESGPTLSRFEIMAVPGETTLDGRIRFEVDPSGESVDLPIRIVTRQ